LLLVYGGLLGPFTGYLKQKPVVEKLGYIPQGEVLKFISADQQQLVAASLVMKTLFYFGGLAEINRAKINIPPDHFAMYRTLEAAVKLDPYNIDAYYFAQAVMAWDAKRIAETNSMLEYGMRYRTWDYYLPFFAGFNCAYFLKDYGKAAHYYRKAAELSGSPLFASLAGRYFHESGNTATAISYLTVMSRTASNPHIRDLFKRRLAAFQAAREIERSVEKFRAAEGRYPLSIAELQKRHYLVALPVDPYGGTFYLGENGVVRSSSMFTSVEDQRDISSIDGSNHAGH
jgi:tetratricopeptide (TPR) repeat protein